MTARISIGASGKSDNVYHIEDSYDKYGDCEEGWNRCNECCDCFYNEHAKSGWGFCTNSLEWVKYGEKCW